MTKDEFLALAAKVEALTGPDRDIDARIGCAIKGLAYREGDVFEWVTGTDPERRFRHISQTGISQQLARDNAPAYTASLEAALTLVPEGWGWLVSVPTAKALASGLLKKHTPILGEVHQGADQRIAVAGATPALALTAAALRAHATTLGD